MFHYNYKITNIKTNEFYVGVRSCKCPIEEDKYMGSSSVWTKIYIQEHKKDLKKEIIATFETRKQANDGEVRLLKLYENQPLCVNCYFDYTPDVTGTKQTPEWINKRKLFGDRNGMFGKHHTEEAKKNMSEKLKGRIVSEEAKKKIGNFHRGKVYGAETRAKISAARTIIWHIKNLKTGEELDTSLIDFYNQHPELNLKSLQRAASYGYPYYKKTYLITKCEASASDSSCKLGENGEPLEVDNPVGSTGNE